MPRHVASYMLAWIFVVCASGCSGGGSTLPAAAPVNPPSSAPALALRSPSLPAAAAAPALSETFSEDALGGAAAGWNVVSGTWSVCSNGSAHAYCETSNATGESLTGSTAWKDYTVDAVVTDPSNATWGGIALLGRVNGANSFYSLELRPQTNGSTAYWYLWKNNGGNWSWLGGGPLGAPDRNVNYHLRLTFAGSSIAAAVAFDGGVTFEPLTTVTDTTFANGQVGIHTWNYGSTNVQNVTVTLPATGPALPAETALPASAFIASIGLNAHFESPIYYDNPAQVSSLVGNLGVRHYRVSAANILFPNGGYLGTLSALNRSAGVTYDVLTDLHTTPANVVHAIALLPAGSVDSVEGPNETDNPGQGAGYDSAFAVDVPAYMQSLSTTLKSTPATAAIPVIGPSFVNSTSYAAIGNIAAFVDAGNMHDYFSGFNPGTNGWGGSGYPFAPSLSYGSIAWNMASSAQATGSKPIDATETGYDTAPIHGGVPLAVQAKYVPRLFLEHVRHGVPRTFLYQLIGYDTTTGDGTLSIVSPALVPNPAYTALAGLINDVLTDASSDAGSVTANWLLGGQTSNVDHLLMHKADGTLVLALWIETESFDPNANGGAGATIAVPAQTVSASFANTAQSGVLWTCNAQTGQWTSTPVTLANGTLNVSVGDTVSVLELAP